MDGSRTQRHSDAPTTPPTRVTCYIRSCFSFLQLLFHAHKFQLLLVKSLRLLPDKLHRGRFELGSHNRLERTNTTPTSDHDMSHVTIQQIPQQQSSWLQHRSRTRAKLECPSCVRAFPATTFAAERRHLAIPRRLAPGEAGLASCPSVAAVCSSILTTAVAGLSQRSRRDRLKRFALCFRVRGGSIQSINNNNV